VIQHGIRIKYPHDWNFDFKLTFSERKFKFDLSYQKEFAIRDPINVLFG
jgi:hypothetical protein